MDIALFDL